MTFSMQIILVGGGGPFSTVQDSSKKQHSFGTLLSLLHVFQFASRERGTLLFV